MKAYLIDSHNRHLYRETIEAMHRHRHTLFVDAMGWTDLYSPDGIDIDQFDTSDTKYIVLLNDEGELVGSDRLNPTIKPHMLANLFPHFASEAIPIDDHIYEWSRHVCIAQSQCSNSPNEMD
jgi:acyl-homoserine lactone synthase